MTTSSIASEPPDGQPRAARTGTAGRQRSALSIPNGRASLGGLLIAAAALATFAAAQPSEPPEPPRFLVADQAIAPGDSLAGQPLRAVAVDLPPELASIAVPANSDLRGVVSTEAIPAGALLWSSTLADEARAPSRTLGQISIAVPADRAVGGRLRIGEHVTVLSTDGLGADALTAEVATRAVIVHLDDVGGGLSDNGTVRLTLAVPPGALGPLAHGGATGTLTVVRPPLHAAPPIRVPGITSARGEEP